MEPYAKCNICFQEREAIYNVQEKRKEKLSFCSEECYRIFFQNILQSNKASKVLDRSRFTVNRKPREEESDEEFDPFGTPPQFKTPDNSLNSSPSETTPIPKPECKEK